MFILLRLLWRFRRILILLTTLLLSADTFTDKKPEDNKHGRQSDADSPVELSKASWRDALKNTKTALKDKDLSTSAAALGYYATLTFFPAVLGLASIYTLFTDPSSLLQILDRLNTVLPTAIADMLHTQLAPIASSSRAHLGLAAVLSVLTLLWTLSGGLQNLIKATNKVYEVEESRSFVKLRLTSVALSVVLLVIGALVIFLLTLQSDALTEWGWPHILAATFPILRWPVLVVLITVLLATIYRYAPDRREPHWQWVSWGASAATLIWLAASALFFIYAQNFANFNRTYGTFAGIIVLMTWFNISSLIVLVGAQVNKKLEDESSVQTTA
jgi:membrane protein